MKLMILIIIDANNAVQNVSTRKPLTSCDTSIKITALITKRNKPKVKIVMGNVKKTSIGLIKAFIMPKTAAAQIAVDRLFIRMPGKR